MIKDLGLATLMWCLLGASTVNAPTLPCRPVFNRKDDRRVVSGRV